MPESLTIRTTKYARMSVIKFQTMQTDCKFIARMNEFGTTANVVRNFETQIRENLFIEKLFRY